MVTAHVVTKDADVMPARSSDRVPSVGVAFELPHIFGMDPAVVLDSDTPPPVGEVEARDRASAVVAKHPVDLGFGQRRANDEQAQVRLLR